MVKILFPLILYLYIDQKYKKTIVVFDQDLQKD